LFSLEFDCYNFYLRDLLEKHWVYLIWGWSVLISLILALAAVFMSLGNTQ